MRKKKEFIADTGNIVESVYVGIEQAIKKRPKLSDPSKIRSVDDIPPKKTSIQ